ncbi:MAG TPA: tetraacyldisaccharide 4'-kinase, partial [Tepidisphaeraceae bacterium]|nr:tetraacyldisaccharide 4'-kinase [Tepidisphaeraceae bacterium]
MIEQYHRELISRQRQGAMAAFLRGSLRAVEPFYAATTSLRNRFYNKRIFSAHRAGSPVISVGNITTGGTGKTPVVLWLAQTLARSGQQPAILLRGYKSSPDGISDE